MSNKLVVSPWMGGLVLAGLTVARDAIYGNQINIPIAGLIVVSGLLLNKLFDENEYQKLFKACGIENKEHQVPIVIKEDKKDNQKTLVIHLPDGVSQRHFEQKQQELEQALNARIQFSYNKNLIMEITDINLKTKYPYVFENCENPLEVFCAMSHNGPLYIDLEKCPHAIVSGESGSGKSSLLRNIVLSLILNKSNIELHLVDFQAVELGIFELCRKVKSYCETPDAFSDLMDELSEENERRLKLFRSVKRRAYINSLNEWNKRYPKKSLPHKVVIIDEFARLAEKEYEDLLERFRTRVSMESQGGNSLYSFFTAT